MRVSCYVHIAIIIILKHILDVFMKKQYIGKGVEILKASICLKMIIVKIGGKMEFFSAFVSEIVRIIGAFWWVFFVLVAIVISVVVVKYKQESNSKEDETRSEVKKEIDKLFTIYSSDEERILGIEFGKEEVEDTLKSIRGLVENLKKAKPFSVRAVEAIYLADKIENRFLLTDNGVLVITAQDSKKLAKIIFNDPLDIVRYILSMKKLIDPNDTKNKVPLKDVLYMLSNAKNFQILSEGKEDEREKDGELLIKLKTAIYDSYFSDVQIGIEQNDDIDSLNTSNNNFMFVSEHLESEDEEKEAEAEKAEEGEKEKDEDVSEDFQEPYLDKDTKLVVNPSVESVAELEDGKIEVIANGFKTVKDDFILLDIYSQPIALSNFR